ncbi:hypothetical protein [Halobacillus aidingensis]|uniref:Uncharacterized protein n=1 Tax=Halobacillus aidingensis TaxID=240303 RepID=A0A1H0JZN0_HALAD|nr:hypothetical protein [Halobacillus aidingensis]SDO49146.1 hypothetical protein SAMN05421677_105178 [Halobacillus aidingensis]
MLWVYIFIGAAGIGLFVLFNWLMGYRKGHIQIDFDERYIDHQEYVQAIEKELSERGHTVRYEGNHTFIVDEKPYVFFERNVPIGGVPLQRTILKPEK